MSTKDDEIVKENHDDEFSKSGRTSSPPPPPVDTTQGQHQHEHDGDETEDEVAQINAQTTKHTISVVERLAQAAQQQDTPEHDNHEEDTMKQCAGVLGDLERRTCANPNTTLEEIEFKKKGDGSRLRVRPRSPIAPKPRRNRTGARRIQMKNNDPRFSRKLRKLTQKLSPVCGDETLATFLMKGYQYNSPMARHAEVPIFDSDDDISDNELEPNVCESCLFCQRDGVRHHKDKTNEIKLIRRVRSPCRCFHTCIQEDEENGKNFIMERFLRQKLDDFSPELNDEAVVESKVKRPHEEELVASEPLEKLPRLATSSDIDEKRKEIKAKSKSSNTSTTELEVVDIRTNSKSPEPIEIVRVSPAKIEPVHQPPKEEFVPQVQQQRKSCHADMSIKRPPMRVSVIQPTGRSVVSSNQSGSDHIIHHQQRAHSHGRPPSMISSTTPSEKLILQQYKQMMVPNQLGSPYHQSGNETVTVKVENQSDDHRYVRPQYTPSLQSGSSGGHNNVHQFRTVNNSQGASWSSQFSSLGSQPPSELMIKQPYSGSCHNRAQMNRLQVPHFTVPPHEQNTSGTGSGGGGTAFPAYQQQEAINQTINHRMQMQQGHPQHIRTCIERLAAGLQVSRHVAEQNENQVTELLRLACEVRREVDCDTFYCTWRDCIKSFNRRDSLVRHLRVHVNVRPFKCERCGTPFLRSDHLRVHMLRHTGEQPFACIVCGVTFSRKDMRNRHMKTTHYRDTTPPQRVLDLLEGESWDAIEVDKSAQPR